MGNYDCGTKTPFFQVDLQNDKDIFKITQILENRLPKSCFVYNAVKLAPKFSDETKIYYFNLEQNISEISGNSWIIATHIVEDHGQNLIISEPIFESEPPASLKEKVLAQFVEIPSKIFNWSRPHWICALTPWTGRIITEIEVEIRGQSIEIHPDILFYMDKGAEITLGPLPQDTRLGPLDAITGADFIASNWAYSKGPKTFETIKNFITSIPNISSGLYSNCTSGGVVPCSGIILHGFGLLSMLYTSEEARGKGYAKLVVQRAAQEMTHQSLYPSLSVEVFNKRSIQFHEGLGFIDAGRLQWFMYNGDKQL